MKIEKINENQIKCTLNKSDLASRQIKASELAYGTEKAKMLFRDMMQQAAIEFGFHAEDLPLMIEAIPLPGDSLILIITKVEEPEELDTRFSNFSPNDDEEYEEIEDEYLEDMEDILDDEDDDYDEDDEDDVVTSSLLEIFQKVRDKLEELAANSDFIPLAQLISESQKNEEIKALETKAPELKETRLMRTYSFHTLKEVMELAELLAGTYHGNNSLYKSHKDDRYYLVMDNSSHTISEFAVFCTMIAEFGNTEVPSLVSEAYYKEHFQKIIENDALQKLHLVNTGG